MKKAVCVIVEDAGEFGRTFLIVSRKENEQLYSFPGGKVEDGESLVEAAKRELFEETGIDINTTNLHKLFTDFDGEYETTCFWATWGLCEKVKTHYNNEGCLVCWGSREFVENQTPFSDYNKKAIGLYYGEKMKNNDEIKFRNSINYRGWQILLEKNAQYPLIAKLGVGFDRHYPFNYLASIKIDSFGGMEFWDSEENHLCGITDTDLLFHLITTFRTLMGLPLFPVESKYDDHFEI